MTSRPVLILLPGLMCDQTVWREQARALGDRYDVQVVGFQRHASLTDMARAVLDHAPARFSIAGHSMGGRVALEIVGLAAERVERIALLDTGAHPAGASESQTRGALVEIGLSQGMGAVADAWLPPMLHPGRHADSGLVSEIRAMIARAGPQLLQMQMRALITRQDARPILQRIGGSCAFIVGREDGWSPPEQHEQMQRQVPGSSLTIIKACGHMATMERPDQVTAALAALMEQPSAG